MKERAKDRGKGEGWSRGQKMKERAKDEAEGGG
jgi:hypothetical protein